MIDATKDMLHQSFTAEHIEPTVADAPAFEERCKKCGGRGQFVGYTGRVLGPCFACKGRGTKTFKTAPTVRAQSRKTAADRKARTAAENWDAFTKAEPEVAAWIVEASGRGFEFAGSMKAAVENFGALTEKQLAACLNSIEKRRAVVEASAKRETEAPEVNVAAIEAAFATATATLKKPVLRFAGFKVSHAKPGSKWEGSLYVVGNGGEYLGRVTSGRFVCTRACPPEKAAEFTAAAADPKGAAIAYGRLTGSCACCGRALDNAESVARGIGPVCAEKYGWGA